MMTRKITVFIYLISIFLLFFLNGCSEELENPVAEVTLKSNPALNKQSGLIGDGTENDIQYDGFFVGKDTTLFDFREYNITEVPPVRPKKPENLQDGCTNAPHENKNTQVVWYVNGANSDVTKQYQNMIEIANTLRQPVIGIHNGSRGGTLQDIILEPNEEVEISIQKSIVQSLNKDQHIQFWVHSQGAFHLSRSLREVNKHVSFEAMQNIDVETTGGAGKFFPDGPQYVHYSNKNDPVPNTAGVTGPLSKPGDRSVIVVFDDVLEDSELPEELNSAQQEFIRAHDQTVYLRNRLDFGYLRSLAPAQGVKIVYRDQIQCIQ